MILSYNIHQMQGPHFVPTLDDRPMFKCHLILTVVPYSKIVPFSNVVPILNVVPSVQGAPIPHERRIS